MKRLIFCLLFMMLAGLASANGPCPDELQVDSTKVDSTKADNEKTYNEKWFEERYKTRELELKQRDEELARRREMESGFLKKHSEGKWQISWDRGRNNVRIGKMDELVGFMLNYRSLEKPISSIEEAEKKSGEFLVDLETLIGLKPDQLKLVKKWGQGDWYKLIYQQLYKGVEIEFKEVSFLFTGTRIEIRNSTSPNFEFADTTPVVKEEDVLPMLRATGKYDFERFEEMKPFFHEWKEEVKLMIILADSQFYGLKETALCYKVIFASLVFLVDAKTGEVLIAYENKRED